MGNENFKYIENFIKSTIESLHKTLDKETIETVLHYLSHNEYEMAFEGLFIEIMNLSNIPEIDIFKSKEIGLILKLDKESVFDFRFWKKFNEWGGSISSAPSVKPKDKRQ